MVGIVVGLAPAGLLRLARIFLGYDLGLPTAIILVIALILSIAIVFTTVAVSRMLFFQSVLADDGIVTAPHILEIGREGVSVESSFHREYYGWSAIQACEEDKQSIYLFLDNSHALIIPKRSFPTGETADAFRAEVGKYLLPRGGR